MTSTWRQYIDRHYADVRRTIQAMGYRCDEDGPKIVSKEKQRGGYVEGKIGKPSITREQSQRVATTRFRLANESLKIQLTDLDDMCHRYGLTLEELLSALVPICLPVHGGWRRKAQRLAILALRGKSKPPGLGFRLTQLTNQKAWIEAREHAFRLGRRVSRADVLDWVQSERMAATILRCRGPVVRSPMDYPPGDMDAYVRATDQNRRRLNKVLRRGILPYRILPRRTP